MFSRTFRRSKTFQTSFRSRARGAPYAIKLQIGSASCTVEVTSEAGAEVQSNRRSAAQRQSLEANTKKQAPNSASAPT
jgi:hypothetical protein